MDVALIYPHQLFSSHPAVEKGRRIYLIEDPLFFGNDPEWPCAMHVQKLVLHRASMKAYARELEGRGYEMHDIECPKGSDTDSGSGGLNCEVVIKKISSRNAISTNGVMSIVILPLPLRDKSTLLT